MVCHLSKTFKMMIFGETTDDHSSNFININGNGSDELPGSLAKMFSFGRRYPSNRVTPNRSWLTILVMYYIILDQSNYEYTVFNRFSRHLSVKHSDNATL